MKKKNPFSLMGGPGEAEKVHGTSHKVKLLMMKEPNGKSYWMGKL